VTTLYERLGVGRGASIGEVRRAYVDLARRHHPDTGGDPDTMRSLNEAWAVLSDPVRRRAYDGSLGPDGRDLDDDGAPVGSGWFGHGANGDDDRWDDVLADLLDDRAVRPVSTSSPLAVVPAGLFAAAVGVAILGIMMSQPALLAFAGFLGFLSVVAVAAVALLTLRGPR
jgi:hypothetical protein